MLSKVGACAVLALAATGPAAAQQGGAPVRQVSAGGFHTCAIRGAETFCWGSGHRGQLGDGGTGIRATPVLVRAPRGVAFTQISAGYIHTCGISGSATYCWGGDDSGQLGNGPDSADQTTPVLVRTPRGVAFTQIAAGESHTCGISGDKTYCWGGGGWGQLGNGSTAAQDVPVLVRTPPGVAFTQIAARFDDTCGISGAETYCWGSGLSGQLGSGVTASQGTPVLIRTPPGVVFTRITVGGGHLCGISGTKTFCWGQGSSGELGYGGVEEKSTPTPVRVPRGVAFTQVTAGNKETCGIADSGTYCWGWGEIGQLGNGGTENRSIPTLVRAPHGVAFTQITLGNGHACGIGGTKVYCWGDRNDRDNDDILPEGQTTPTEITWANP